MPPVLLHRRPEALADPDAFRPERWLGPQPPDALHLPFGAGTRRCLGEPLAHALIDTAIPAILQRLERRAARPRPEKMVLRAVRPDAAPSPCGAMIRRRATRRRPDRTRRPTRPHADQGACMPSMTSAPRRALARVRQAGVVRANARRFAAALHPVGTETMQVLGDLGYGGYALPAGALAPDSKVVLAGTGTDITFDLLLIARYGCDVLALDPVPAAEAYVRDAAAHEPRHHFQRVGLWDREQTLTFHAPRVEGYVSHSATDMHGTEAAFTADAQSVKSVMEGLGTEHLDLLKISAEGSEYRILEHVLQADLDVRILCCEFATPVEPARPLASLARLAAGGWRLRHVHAANFNWKVTLTRDR